MAYPDFWECSGRPFSTVASAGFVASLCYFGVSQLFNCFHCVGDIANFYSPTRVRARESYSFFFYRCFVRFATGEPRNVSVTLTPFDIESFPDGAMDLHFGSSGTEQLHNVSDALVNFPPVSFSIRHTLAGADDCLFLGVTHDVHC